MMFGIFKSGIKVVQSITGYIEFDPESSNNRDCSESPLALLFYSYMILQKLQKLIRDTIFLLSNVKQMF